MFEWIKSLLGKTKEATKEELQTRLYTIQEARQKLLEEQIEITSELEKR